MQGSSKNKMLKHISQRNIINKPIRKPRTDNVVPHFKATYVLLRTVHYISRHTKQIVHPCQQSIWLIIAGNSTSSEVLHALSKYQRTQHYTWHLTVLKGGRLACLGTTLSPRPSSPHRWPPSPNRRQTPPHCPPSAQRFLEQCMATFHLNDHIVELVRLLFLLQLLWMWSHMHLRRTRDRDVGKASSFSPTRFRNISQLID